MDNGISGSPVKAAGTHLCISHTMQVQHKLCLLPVQVTAAVMVTAGL